MESQPEHSVGIINNSANKRNFYTQPSAYAMIGKFSNSAQRYHTKQLLKFNHDFM